MSDWVSICFDDSVLWIMGQVELKGNQGPITPFCGNARLLGYVA